MTTSAPPPDRNSDRHIINFRLSQLYLTWFHQRQKRRLRRRSDLSRVTRGPPVWHRTECSYAFIHLHEEQIRKWPALVDEAVSPRMIHRKSLMELIGGLTFTQTSIFWRFGRTPNKPLYKMLYPNHYSEILTGDDVRIPEWRGAPIRATIPGIAEIKSHRSEILIYTDAEAAKSGVSSAILAVVVTEPGLLAADGYPATALTEKTDPVCETIFSTTTYIYGIELLAVVATVFCLRDFARGENVVLYVGNSDAKNALVDGFPDTPIINTLVQIFWAFPNLSDHGFGPNRSQPTETFATPPQDEWKFQPPLSTTRISRFQKS